MLLKSEDRAIIQCDYTFNLGENLHNKFYSLQTPEMNSVLCTQKIYRINNNRLVNWFFGCELVLLPCNSLNSGS